MNIKDKLLTLPIIQGGMGVGISLGNLAGAVAATGAMGVISTADIGFLEADFWKNPLEANIRALKKEIEKAKMISKNKGLIAINAMVATKDYAVLVKKAIEFGIDCVISGAGLPLELPKISAGSHVAISPIVSSSKAAKTICKLWNKRFGVLPDFIVVEGPRAGGHLGFDADEVISATAPKLEDIVSEVVESVKSFEEEAGRKIPVFAAGGVYDSDDVKKMMSLGASGVQVATRFIGTYECDASEEYKQRYVECKKEDIQIVKSPVGMPGRALRTPLIERLENGRIAPTKCVDCLIPCDPRTTLYCITLALMRACKGDYQNGLFFCGDNAWRIDKIVSVKELVSELLNGVSF